MKSAALSWRDKGVLCNGAVLCALIPDGVVVILLGADGVCMLLCGFVAGLLARATPIVSLGNLRLTSLGVLFVACVFANARFEQLCSLYNRYQ